MVNNNLNEFINYNLNMDIKLYINEKKGKSNFHSLQFKR